MESIQRVLHRHAALWRDKAYIAAVLQSIVILVVGAACGYIGRLYLSNMPHPVESPDLILDLIPTMGMENFLVWGVPLVIATILAILFYKPERLPFAVKTLGLLYFVRSFFVILTPMGVREDQFVQLTTGGILQNLAYGSNDFFFSGHTATPFLFAVIFWQDTWIRSVMLGWSTLFAGAVLLAHTHYSIDVFAVPFMVPTIVLLARKMWNTTYQAKTV